jgi:glycine cleavage system H protein
MSEVPADLRYTKSHEWVRANDDGTVTIGITQHAQDQLGDMVYVEVPEAGRSLEAGEACAVVESVKAASDVYAPIAGDVVEGNEALADAPETVNSDPFGAGWILRMTPADAGALASLMDAAAYQELLAAEDH